MTRKNDKARVAVVGIGGRGAWFAKTLAKNDQFELVALCDQNVARLETHKKDEGLERVAGYDSVTTCLDKEQIDAVFVTTSDRHHAEVTIPVLEAGKYVYLEKPLEITEDACVRIVESDERAGGKTFVGLNLRFAPVYAKIKDLIDGGELGDLLTVQADVYYDNGRTYFRRWNRFREFGGGLWVTKASHDFDILCWLVGKSPVSVCSVSALSYYTERDDAAMYCSECDLIDTCYDSYYTGKEDVEAEKGRVAEVERTQGGIRLDLCLYNSEKDTFDHGITTVAFEGDTFATFTCNVVAGFSSRRIRVSGTKGSVDGELGGENLILYRRDPSRREDMPVGGTAAGHGGADTLIFDSFYRFTQGLEQPKVGPREATTAVLMGIAATRSGDEKRRVHMSEFGL